MQLQVQILPAEGIPLGVGGGPPGTFYLMTEDADIFATEDGDEMVQEQ